MEPIYLVVFYDEDANYHFDKVGRTELVERLNNNYYGDINIKFVDNDPHFNQNWDMLIMLWKPVVPKSIETTTKWKI